jgi:hypothetical protein
MTLPSTWDATFWQAPDSAGRIICIRVRDGFLEAECEGGIFEIYPDGSSVGVIL